MGGANMLFGGSVRLGRLLRTEIRIHNLYLMLIAFRLITAGESWRFTLAWEAMLVGIILCHEFGHCLAARAMGGSADEILMWPLGGLAFARAPMRPWPQFVTIVCGPLVNLVFCVLSGLYLVVAAGGNWSVISIWPGQGGLFNTHFNFWVSIFFMVNQWLLYFNLLPMFPLDGGQTLRAILWFKLGLTRATIICCQIGIAGAVLLGLWSLQRSGLGMGMGIALAFFVGSICMQHLQMARMGMLVDESVATYSHTGRYHRKRSFWQRLFGSRARVVDDDEPAPNPNPGGWERKQTEIERLEQAVDQILEKVNRHGMESLSYTERQTLERASRMRKNRDLHGGGVA